MTYKEKIINCSSLDELFELWINKPSANNIDHKNNYFIADGIVNQEVWGKNNNKKILFVLKEAYGKDWGDLTLTTWLNEYHPYNYSIWKRISKFTYGVQHTSANKLARYRTKLSTQEHNDCLEQIAVLNIKKSNGESSSHVEDLIRYAEYDREEIKKEFELIDADIVICGNTFKIIYETVYENASMGDNCSDNWYYYISIDGKDKKRLFIDFYHPANHWPDLLNYYGLINIYQQALIEYKL